MPAAPSEPEKYSIDEMLERLKEKPSENPATEGELVIRADGTQAIRVRKRKRRTEQPKRNEAKRLRRARVIQVTSALVLLLLTGLSIAAAYVYANTAPYRKSITTAIARGTGADVKFEEFRVSPASANAKSITLQWPEGNPLKSIQLRDVVAKISPISLLGIALRSDEISAREGNLALQAPASESPLLVASDQAGNIPIQFSRISVPKFSITAGDPTQPTLKIAATEASLRMDKTHSQASLHLFRGNIQIAGWPIFKLDRAVMEFHGDETELNGLRVYDSQTKPGILELAGTIRPFSAESPSTLNVKLENFDLGELLGPEFSDLISARIDTRGASRPNSLSFLPSSRSSVDLALAFKSYLSSKVSVKGFPFLLSLVRTLNDKWYESPVFVGDATGLIHRKGALVELQDLQLESKSRMAIKLSIAAAADKSLAGTVEIGIPESVAELSQNTKIISMLTPQREGYRWLTLIIGGTLAHPNDNFAELYAAAKDMPAGDTATKDDLPTNDNLPTGDTPTGDNLPTGDTPTGDDLPTGDTPTGDPASPTAPGVDPEKAFDNITRPKKP
jgi:hypothetical protein